jgi:hypothetical protein
VGPAAPRETAFMAALALSLTCLACDERGREAPTGPTYEARCRVTVADVAEPEVSRVEGTGDSREDAEAAAWTAFCARHGLAPDCQNALPDGLRAPALTCASFAGTGFGLAGPAHSCTLTVEERRAGRRAEAVVQRSGQGDALENYATELCQQALAQACVELGAPPDCTAGDNPAFQVLERSAGRQMTGARPAR